MPISPAITRITRPGTRPVVGAQTMPGSADIGHPLAPTHTHNLPHSGLSRRATPIFAGQQPVDSATNPHAPAGKRQSWIASTVYLALEGQRNLSEYSSSLPLLVPLGKAESYNGPLRSASIFFPSRPTVYVCTTTYSSSMAVSSASCFCFSRTSLPFPRASVTSFQSLLDSANTLSFPS